jgi:NitT/TauT family transport system permease protein
MSAVPEINGASPITSHADYLSTQRRQARRQTLQVLFCQLGVMVLFFGAWELLTRIPWFIENTVFDPFFVSQPSKISVRMVEWVLPGRDSIWPHLMETLTATFLGLLVGAGSGFVVGLALAQSRFAARVFNPFIVALNSMPRVAFVPLITLLFGFGILSKVVTAWFVVFFLLFFNTYKGSLSVQRELIEFCRTLGASNAQILWRVRIPFGAAWTFAALPNAVSFALVGVVLSEFVGSATGMGYVMIVALAALNATDMFAAIGILSIVGVGLVYIVRLIEARLLHWSAEFLNEI